MHMIKERCSKLRIRIDKFCKLNKATTTLTWRTNISKIKQLQIKIVTNLKILGFRNIFGVFKVLQPHEYEFSIIKIDFPLYVVEAPALVFSKNCSYFMNLVFFGVF